VGLLSPRHGRSQVADGVEGLQIGDIVFIKWTFARNR